MRRISTAARRRQRHWRTMSVRNLGGATTPASPLQLQFVSNGSMSLGLHSSSTDPRYHRASMSTSTMAFASCWVKDVLRTKRLSPPNPILESLPSAEEVLEGLQRSGKGGGVDDHHHQQQQQQQHKPPNLPAFSILQPHHLEKAAEEISRQHDVELAQLEVRWTSVSGDETESGSENDDLNSTNGNSYNSKPSSLCSLLLDLDRLTAPVVQLQEVSELYETLASPPDMIEDWIKASESVDSRTTKQFVENLYRSRIIYRTLATAISENQSLAAANTNTKTPSFLIPFLKRGAHIDTDVDGETKNNADSGVEAEAEGMQQIQEELSILNDRLDSVVSYDRASKAMRLQCMSDMYNCIGLSRLQAEYLVPHNAEGAKNTVWELARLQHKHMVESPQKELIESLFPEIISSLESFLPKQTKLDLDGAGAFLDGKSEIGSSASADAARLSLKAKFDFKQRIRLHGVLKGFIDFCDQILGIVIIEDTDANNREAGWSKNVRLLHLYQKAEDDSGDNENKNNYLGTIYFDPFADSYWRTEDAKDLVKTRLFSQQATGQTIAPIAVVALKITPIWDDTPVPMTWKDTRDLLYQLGSAIQLVLDQSRQQKNYHRNDHETIEPAPIDTSDFLAHFLEMWLQNDGFLHRLAQLSQEESVLDDETIEILRNDLRNEKALELTNTMFLSALQFTVFESFDPRGDETLVSLQERLAVQYLPGSNLPDPSDLSPLLAVFQESGVDQKMSAYGTLWSEVLAATVFETFQKTDLRNQEEVHRLGTGIRDLFLQNNSGRPLSNDDFADLCKTPLVSIGSGDPLKRVYGFETTTEQ